jgi:hypothetical protein
MRSKARQGFDALLALHSGFDVVRVEWQDDGPWVLVELGQPSVSDGNVFARHPYAIWKRTGAVHGMHDGAVSDDPLLTP